ncbi:hypothetical protein, partial [Pseudomonas syringae group genomosp. 7]|uniref:hypothetical protein n=1 Tax=Pseudomonas syringae group genomosp. 7 TaxID=251699 RepID=UPI00376F7DD3
WGWVGVVGCVVLWFFCFCCGLCGVCFVGLGVCGGVCCFVVGVVSFLLGCVGVGAFWGWEVVVGGVGSWGIGVWPARCCVGSLLGVGGLFVLGVLGCVVLAGWLLIGGCLFLVVVGVGVVVWLFGCVVFVLCWVVVLGVVWGWCWGVVGRGCCCVGGWCGCVGVGLVCGGGCMVA